MSKVNRGEKLLNRLVTENKITSCGRDWIICSLDPFHDSQLDNLEGWPDMECGASVVRCVKKSVTVKKPALSISGNWDCHIQAWPMLQRNVVAATIGRLNNVFNTHAYPLAVASGAIGGVQISGSVAGTDWQPIDDATKTISIAHIELDAEYTQGSGRLIGMAFEVHDTTAELYKQGSVVVYRQQADNRDPFTATCYNGTIPNPYSGGITTSWVRMCPQNTSQAMLIQGSRQWSSEEGCYVVSAFCSEENPATPTSPMGFCVPTSALSHEDVDNDANSTPVYMPRIRNLYDSNPMIYSSRIHPIHQSGAIFSGLNEQSTLTINVNYFYESFPAPSDKSVLVLAKPSCKYDPCVMELYSRLVQELPVGVPVRENGLGDWFLDAATKAAKFIGPALAALPHPIAKGAGAALTYLGNTGGQYVKSQSQFQAPPNAWGDPMLEQNPSLAMYKPQKQPTIDWGQEIKKDKKKVKKAKKTLAKAKAQKQQGK